MNVSTIQHNPGGRSRPAWPANSIITAYFSECGHYRYELSEVWDQSKPLVLWILMNPSVACCDYSDPTLIKTGKFARAWGYGGQLIGNVHAYRATDKKRLLEVEDPIGPDNDKSLLRLAGQAQKIILAYGQPPNKLKKQGQKVINMLMNYPGLSYLRLAKDGKTPVHPLYLSATLTPKFYREGSE